MMTMDSMELMRNLAQPSPGKIILLVLDGLGGLPRPNTGKTELETADTPMHVGVLAIFHKPRNAAPDYLARRGWPESVADLARGVLGVVTAAIVLRCLLVRPVHPEKVIGALLVVVTVIGWAGAQYGPVFLDAFRAYRSFPVLADFRSRGAAERWRTESAIVRRIAAPSGSCIEPMK